jgi:hypothetical protein
MKHRIWETEIEEAVDLKPECIQTKSKEIYVK